MIFLLMTHHKKNIVICVLNTDENYKDDKK